MGLMDRLNKRFRKETASFLTSSTLSKNAPPSFLPDLIRKNITNVEDLEHLAEVARKDPLANYIVYKLAENTLDDWFKFTDNDGNEIMLDVQKELKLLDAKKGLTLALEAERAFGYTYLYTGKSRFVPKTREGGRIASLFNFSPLEANVYEYAENGEPSSMEVHISVGKGMYTVISQRMVLPASDFIFMNTRPIGRGYKGRPATESVWDMLIYVRELLHSMTFFGRKMGTGIFTIITSKGITDELKGKMNTAFSDISNRRALVIDGDQIEDMKFVGPTGAVTDFEGHILVCLKMIAAGTGVPLDALVGVLAGNIAGSETNIKSLYASLNQIQSSIEVYIRELVLRMGFSNEDYNIEWNARYAHDEEEQSKIAMNNAQTLAIRSTWLTKNEIRAEEGLPPIEGGDELTSDIQIGVSGFQTPEEQEQTRNPEGEQL